jgi:hypothetical protein
MFNQKRNRENSKENLIETEKTKSRSEPSRDFMEPEKPNASIASWRVDGSQPKSPHTGGAYSLPLTSDE